MQTQVPDDLQTLVSDLVAQGEAKNRRAANMMYEALTQIALRTQDPEHWARWALRKRNQGDQ